MIESIIFPKTDHSLCLNCQVEKGNPHLCGSCQWYASNVFDERKKQKLVDQKLDEMEGNLELEDSDGEPITVSFSKCSISYVIDLLEQTISNKNSGEVQYQYQKDSLKILKEIEKMDLNYSICSDQNMYETVDYEN